MARLEVSFDDGFMTELGKLADVERLAPKLIDAALPIILEKLRQQYGRFRLAEKLKLIKAKGARNGGYIGTVTLKGNTGHYYKKGKGRYQLSNAGLAVFLEFGTDAHGNFPARQPGGYVARAVAAAEDEVKAKMQETFEAEAGNLRL